MTKSYYYQVYPVLNSCLYWCVAFTYSVFGSLDIVLYDDSLTNKNGLAPTYLEILRITSQTIADALVK